MAKKNINALNLEKIEQLAAAYGLSDNAVFLAACDLYLRGQANLDAMQVRLEEAKEDPDLKNYASLIQQYSKTADGMVKCLGQIVAIIRHIGTPKETTDEFDEFMNK